VELWGDRNVKTIRSGEIQKFLFSQQCSEKTRANIRSAIHSFWTWLVKSQEVRPDQAPYIPPVSFELGWRPTISKAEQTRILAKVREISWDVNPKVWLGCRWLTIYVALRPDDLRRLREEDINTSEGWLRLLRPTKRRKPKYLPLLEEDCRLVEELRSVASPLPHLPFYRHKKGYGGVQPGSPFGKKVFWKWWNRACDSLGIPRVELYGSTRHSSVQDLGQDFTPEEIRIHATVHDTNRAFERYFRRETSRAREIYKRADQRAKEAQAGAVIAFNKG
jgi:integrase